MLDLRLHWAVYQHHDAEDLAAIVNRLWDTTQHYRRAFTRLACSGAPGSSAPNTGC